MTKFREGLNGGNYVWLSCIILMCISDDFIVFHQNERKNEVDSAFYELI